MAQLEYNGVADLIRDLSSFAEAVPEMGKRMLEAEADVVEPALKQSLASEGLIKTGRLRSSIDRSVKKKGTEIRLGPAGEHHKYVSRAGRVGVLRAGHLGYILEHGAPRRNIRGRKWMSKTVLKTQGRALAAAETVRDEYLKNHNL